MVIIHMNEGGYVMYAFVRHECGGHAHSVNPECVHGWNLYCCNRCGAVFYYWITEEMLVK